MARKRAKILRLGTGKLRFKVRDSYPVPAERVWEAITQARHVEKYFVPRVSGDFGPRLTTVEWHWKKWGSFPLQPTVIKQEKKLEFVWANWNRKYLTTVTFTLKSTGKATQLEIHERGWNERDLANAFGNCTGWSTYLAYLKAYLIWGIDLRTEKE